MCILLKRQCVLTGERKRRGTLSWTPSHSFPKGVHPTQGPDVWAGLHSCSKGENQCRFVNTKHVLCFHVLGIRFWINASLRNKCYSMTSPDLQWWGCPTNHGWTDVHINDYLFRSDPYKDISNCSDSRDCDSRHVWIPTPLPQQNLLDRGGIIVVGTSNPGTVLEHGSVFKHDNYTNQSRQNVWGVLK